MKNLKNTIFAGQKTIGSINLIKLTAILLFCMSGIAMAQDKIIFKDGLETDARIIEITGSEIKYKSFTNLNGPVHIITKNEIQLIRYENGAEDYFNNEKTMKTTAGQVNKQLNDSNAFVQEKAAKFGGPRFGFTYITSGTQSSRLTEMGKNPLITQFGWQFETRLFNVDKGPSGIIEFVPLIGGMEQGLFLPSANLLIGMRGSGTKSFEFAVGPNLSISGLGMVFAIGTNFRSGSVNFPVNLAYVPSVSSKEFNYNSNSDVIVQTGHRISLTIGFNLRKK